MASLLVVQFLVIDLYSVEQRHAVFGTCLCVIDEREMLIGYIHTGELGYDGLRKIGPSYAKSVIYM